MAAAGLAFESAVPAWLLECKTAIEAQGKGATYSYSKMRDFLMEKVPDVREHLRSLLQALTKRSFNAELTGEGVEGKRSRSQRVLAERMGRCQRTVQYGVVQAEKAGLITVKRRRGKENEYFLGIGLLIRAGALYVKPEVKPKPPAPPPSPQQIREASRKAESASAQFYRFLNEGKDREEAMRLSGLTRDPSQKRTHAGLPDPSSELRKLLSTISKMESPSTRDG